MDYLIRFVDVLVWPAAVVALAVMFRRELVRLAKSMSSLKYGEFEAKFDRELRAVEADAKSIQSRPFEAPKVPAEASEYDRLVRLAEISPRAAIAEAWRSVELAAAAAARGAGVDAPPRSPVTFVVRSLVGEGVFSESAIEVFDRLRRLRNEAVHAPEFALEYLNVEPYIELALRLEQDLFHAGNAVAIGRGRRRLVSESEGATRSDG